VCLGAVQPRTPSPEDVLRGAGRVPPAGGTAPVAKAVRGSAFGKMGLFTVGDNGLTNSLD
jgi:hypothetical protein